ncbi:hypothetical protein [Nocardioides panacisoli]|uniref:Lipoprotein n=1 Tax=Nocardioides panacisoli TaxID=627624 RepID=A0ABP7IG41_9ACTN
MRSGLVVLAGVLALTAGCGDAAKDSPPTGVDGLQIPTPSPDPDDFVADVDNPWLALEPGATWRYTVTGAGRITAARISVSDGPEHDGIRTTDLARTTLDDKDRQVDRVVDHLAQDRDGNVWWLGRGSEWFDAAGLYLPAEPRVGDGYLMADLPDGEVHAMVRSVDASASVPAGDYETLDIDVVGAQAADLLVSFAKGTGLVATATADGSVEWGLVAVDEPPSS